MTNKKILKKAISKVFKNGYDIEMGGAGGIKIFNGKQIAEKIITPR